ncbi:COG4223 family protein [Puniceibacterium sediminis]|uniref:Uncharacterized conserved protein n=1 Tax=Puniceibacterium sediminis TaxID=1608407 RepID=A0A238WVC0_9RHOB|nr:hypothetical protein [Puniceibacterium sediminis]SNR50482.1 Uncharacterized conserved protein [Puniceibacterium sediminis]
MADEKNSKDTRDQIAGSDENETETVDVSTEGSRQTGPETVVAEPEGSVEQTKPDADSAIPDAEAEIEPDQHTESETLSVDPADMPDRDEASVDGGFVEGDPASTEGGENPPETELNNTGTTPAPQVIKETTVERKAGFFPALIGGVLAAGVGFGVAQYESNDWPFGPGTEDPFRAQTSSTLKQQRTQLDDLAARLGNAETVVGAFDVSDLTEAVARLNSQIDDLKGQLSGASDQIGRLEVRVVELEKRPMEAALSPEAVAAYEREMDALRSDIESQRNEIQNFAAEAVAAEQNAESQANLAGTRAALAKVTTALESGEPFEEQLGTLQSSGSVTVPAALSSVAADGVPTLSELAADYPGAARAALAAARAEEAPEGGTSHVFNFFRNQVGARSVTPRDGDDADAILSRAEAALKSGDVAGSLAEVKTLSQAAQDAMGDWIPRAETRVSAQGAATTLAQELNQE